MKLISPAYREENRELHQKPGYGSSGHLWLGHIVELADKIGANTVLDYGAGKATLGPYIERLGLKYTPYDPATFPAEPEGLFDIVVCLDVLEHIEPENLPDVIAHMHALTGKIVFAVVSTRASSKELSDGRNAHLIQKTWGWWKRHLHKGGHWSSLRIRQHFDTFEFVGTAKAPRGVSGEQAALIRGH